MGGPVDLNTQEGRVYLAMLPDVRADTCISCRSYRVPPQEPNGRACAKGHWKTTSPDEMQDRDWEEWRLCIRYGRKCLDYVSEWK